VFADYQNLANSAVIADKTNADAIYATPTIAVELAFHIKNYYDPSKIKLLALGSETLTDSHRRQLKLLYPNAKIANLYASSEIGQYILYPCKEIMNEDENTFHLLDEAVMSAELIDNELIVTYSKNKALPLIRYKTGDSFEIVNDKCKCGLAGPILKWLGRKEIDKIRITGIEIHTEDVENVFSKISGHIGSQYQLHFYEIKDEGKNKVKIVIEIINPLGKESPVSNMIIEKVKELSFKSSKTRRLVNHIQ
jgi:phenylacetate-CoA ligase